MDCGFLGAFQLWAPNQHHLATDPLTSRRASRSNSWGPLACTYDACGESIRRRRPKPVRLPSKCIFKNRLLMDVFYCENVTGLCFSFLNTIDDATDFQVVSCLDSFRGHRNPTLWASTSWLDDASWSSWARTWSRRWNRIPREMQPKGFHGLPNAETLFQWISQALFSLMWSDKTWSFGSSLQDQRSALSKSLGIRQVWTRFGLTLAPGSPSAFAQVETSEFPVGSCVYSCDFKLLQGASGPIDGLVLQESLALNFAYQPNSQILTICHLKVANPEASGFAVAQLWLRWPMSNCVVQARRS